MSRADQFESVFRAAARQPFVYRPVAIRSVLTVTDLPAGEAESFTGEVRGFLSVLGDGIAWRTLTNDDYATVQSLLDIVEAGRPDLICVYRNLLSAAWRFPHTLGDHVEVLTQVTDVPVLVLPHPEAGRAAGHAMRNTDTVMAITDHLVGDDRLVNCAARFTSRGGRLLLTHVEDQLPFERFMDVISKIQEIDTDLARERIGKRLLKEAGAFIDSCRAELARHELEVTVEQMVSFGHRLREYESLVANHGVDMLVFHTKDDDQLAMHGLAHPLAVQLRHVPLLMI
ncbi:MAG: hypothetical protein IID31_08770 [Planctomycetes bacterium]|nr:hypothetical protein [Planctomycetota bacterium]